MITRGVFVFRPTIHALLRKAALDIDWDDVVARRQALGEVVGQARALVSWAQQRLPDTMQNPDVVEAHIQANAEVEINGVAASPDTVTGETD